MDSHIVIVAVLLIVFLFVLNMGLCYWIGFVTGKKSSSKPKGHPVQQPERIFVPSIGPQAPTATTTPTVRQSVPQMVPGSRLTTVQSLPRVTQSPIVQPQQRQQVLVAQSPGGPQHRTLMGITCAPQVHPSVQMVSSNVKRESPPPQSYDSSVFTDDPLTHTSEDEHRASAAASVSPISGKGQPVLYYTPRY